MVAGGRLDCLSAVTVRPALLFSAELSSDSLVGKYKLSRNKPLEIEHGLENTLFAVLIRGATGCKKTTQLSCCLADHSLWQTNRKQ